MGDVVCFWIEPAEPARSRLALRRFSSMDHRPCPHMPADRPQYSFHDARVPIGDAPPILSTAGYEQPPSVRAYDGDPRWPAACACGYVFDDDDEWQVFTQRVYVRTDTGDELTLRDAPPGAMWDAHWMSVKGPDGLCVVVRLPNGRDWMIDSRASNCTLPDDAEHRCWVRHGQPPRLTVDKDGLTCAAGGGSIASGQGATHYHGYLRDGRLVEA